MPGEFDTGSDALNNMLGNLAGNPEIKDDVVVLSAEEQAAADELAKQPAAIETARVEARATELGKTVDEVIALEVTEAEGVETARIAAKAIELGKTVDEVKTLESTEAAAKETERIQAKATELGKTVDEVKAIEEQEGLDATAQAEMDAMNDFEFTLQHDLDGMGIKLSDDEYAVLDALNLNDLDFSKTEDHAKYMNAMASVLKPRYQNDLLGSYKPETLKVMNFVENGGDIAKYATAKANSYADLEAVDADNDNHIEILAKLLVEQSNGAMDEATALKYAKLNVADGDGFTKAKEAVTALKAIGSAKVQKEQDAATAEASSIAAKAQAHITRYNTTLDKGELAVGGKTYKVNQEDAVKLKACKTTKFVDDESGNMYDLNGKVTKVVGDAMTVMQALKYNLGVDGEALLDLLVMNGKFDGLVERTVATQGASRIRKRTSAAPRSGNTIKRTVASSTPGAKPELSLSRLVNNMHTS